MVTQDVVVPEGALSSNEIMRLSGITFRQLDEWCRKGALRPDQGSKCGSGVARTFSIGELRVARVLAGVARARKSGSSWPRSLLAVRIDELRVAIEQGARFVVLTNGGTHVDEIPAESGLFVHLA